MDCPIWHEHIKSLLVGGKISYVFQGVDNYKMILGYTSIVKVLKLQKHYGGNIQTIKKLEEKPK